MKSRGKCGIMSVCRKCLFRITHPESCLPKMRRYGENLSQELREFTVDKGNSGTDIFLGSKAILFAERRDGRRERVRQRESKMEAKCVETSLNKHWIHDTNALRRDD